MKIKTITYSALFNLGNFENEKITLEAQIGQDETPEQVFKELKAQAMRLGGRTQEMHDTLEAFDDPLY